MTRYAGVSRCDSGLPQLDQQERNRVAAARVHRLEAMTRNDRSGADGIAGVHQLQRIVWAVCVCSRLTPDLLAAGMSSRLVGGLKMSLCL